MLSNDNGLESCNLGGFHSTTERSSWCLAQSIVTSASSFVQVNGSLKTNLSVMRTAYSDHTPRARRYAGFTTTLVSSLISANETLRPSSSTHDAASCGVNFTPI